MNLESYKYYERNGITIYCGDCREILPQIDVKVDLVLTDPPFPDHDNDHGRDWPIPDMQSVFPLLPGGDTVRQFVFWSARAEFFWDYTAVHIWWKRNSQSSHRYERIFERNGAYSFFVFDDRVVTSPVTAQFARDTFWNHPTQKPESLIRKLLVDGAGYTVLDPFLGSGTTAVAAKKLGRKCIGIEIEEKYCALAVKRLQQEVMTFDSAINPVREEPSSTAPLLLDGISGKER